MESSSIEEDKNIEKNIIREVRSFFRLKKEINDNAIKDITNIYGLEEENKAIKYRIIKDIKNFFEHGEEENY